MLSRLALVFAVLVLVETPLMVAANPITYDFSGTFSQPFDGSTAFSGSATFNATPTPQDATWDGAGWNETGSDVSLTLNAGGQVFNFGNSPQDTFVGARVSVGPSSPLGTLPSLALSLFGYAGASGIGTSTTFGVTMYSYGIGTVPPNLASLSFPVYTSTVVLQELSEGTISGGAGGALTSFEMVSTPEPSTLVIFASLGVAALVHHRCRGSLGRGHRGQQSSGA
jgi:hypothetical protein